MTGNDSVVADQHVGVARERRSHSDPSISAVWTHRLVRPTSFPRESQRFQSPVTVFTVQSAPSPAAPALWV